MNQNAKSLRAFIGTLNFEESRRFYKELGFEESIIFPNMSYFKISDSLGFYLQDYYNKDWINNTMLFLEVESAQEYWSELHQLQLPEKYKNVKLKPVQVKDWGKECFLHDPSGVLWHFGEFN